MSPTPDRPARSQSGEVTPRLTELHYAILERLPDLGTELGWQPATISARHLRDQLQALRPDATLTSSALSTELRSMALTGLVQKVTSVHGTTTLGWQRTPRGAELLAAHRGREQ